ncbi:MAG: glycerol-3-phosphate 1-O-acyltransferase PlsY [Clostridia bacterium]|nr:glycerol-3-phosphate 1-O-acyltransferase PlsY [Clostridia bacterium]
MIWIFAAIVAVGSYLLGSINSSIIISRLISGTDIRTEGSGNAGATNMLRTHGKKAAVMTLLGDMLKGVLAVLLSILFRVIIKKFLVPEDYFLMSSMVSPTVFGVSVSDFELVYVLSAFRYIAGFFVVMGHNFPVFFGFKGGKGIATSAAVLLVLDWRIGLIVILVALLVMVITRYVSLGSVVSAVAYPFILIGFMLGRQSFEPVYLVFSLLLSGLSILRHKANIKRLILGEETKIGKKKTS